MQLYQRYGKIVVFCVVILRTLLFKLDNTNFLTKSWHVSRHSHYFFLDFSYFLCDHIFRSRRWDNRQFSYYRGITMRFLHPSATPSQTPYLYNCCCAQSRYSHRATIVSVSSLKHVPGPPSAK